MKSSGLGNLMTQLLMLFFGLVLLAPGLMLPGGLTMTP